MVGPRRPGRLVGRTEELAALDDAFEVAADGLVVVLVAGDGEWTRRRIDGPEVARRLSRDLAIPVYDAQVTGYPQRMRDWNARQRREQDRRRRDGRG